MKHMIRITLLAFVTAGVTVHATAQWRCLYATYDDETNGTGNNTPSVGVIAEDIFVSLVLAPNLRNYMIPYVNADSAMGRVNFAGYFPAPPSGPTVFQFWTDGVFDQVALSNAAKLVATPDSLIYVANNDVNHNALVFKFTGDTVTAVSPYLRQETGSNRIFGIAVDANGYVYVCNDTSQLASDDIKIYNPITQWTSHNDTPVRTIDLPDGVYRGITVSPSGDQLFVCDYGNRKIVKYTGSPGTGYTEDGTFAFQLSLTDTIPNTSHVPGPINLAYLESNNILAAAVDAHGYTSATRAYNYGRIYLINPFTGGLISNDSSVSVIDVAQWNLDVTGGYSSRSGEGTASGYTSTYDVDFDENGNVYSQSHFGWTVEKWSYNGTLPVISGVERVSNTLPEAFRLEQNYPNPFNPATTIEFTVLTTGTVSLKVHDLLGREVAVLAQGQMATGTYRATFDAQNLPGGIYFYTLQTHDGSVTKKMTLVK